MAQANIVRAFIGPPSTWTTIKLKDNLTEGEKTTKNIRNLTVENSAAVIVNDTGFLETINLDVIGQEF